MTTIPHNYQWACGKTVFWDTSDSEVAYNVNLLDPQNNKQLQRLGYTNNPIIYQYNSHGFRSIEFDQPIDVVCFGCSFTMGTGLHYQNTWPAQLAEFTNLSVANLAHAGSSNDTAFRMALHYLPLIKPKYALWLQTDRHRVEIIDDSSNISTNLLANDKSNDLYSDNNFVKQWFASDSNQQLNLEKNTRAFKHLCDEINISYVVLSRNSIVTIDLARDLKHPGTNSNTEIAKKFLAEIHLGGKSTS